MGKAWASLVAVGALVVATPAAAATVIFSSGGTNATTNSKIFTGNDGTKVKVTAFSIDATGKIVAGQLGQWSGGLGIQNSSTDDSHTLDNSGWKDFFLLSFSDYVQLGNATFTTNYTYNNGTGLLRDTDATIGSGILGAAWNSNLNGLVGANQSVLYSLGLYGSNSTSTSSTQTRDINPLDRGGTLWLVGASFQNPDTRIDGFKFKSLTYSVATPPPPPVPEPGTWAMMILGFGVVGGAMRKRKQQALVTA